MNKYSIIICKIDVIPVIELQKKLTSVLVFSNDGTFLNAVDDKSSTLIFDNSWSYSTCVQASQDGVQFLLKADANDITVVGEKHKGSFRVENIIMDYYENYILKTDHNDKSPKLFSQYLYYIVNHFVNNNQALPGFELPRIDNLIFVVPRIWGYHLDETDIDTILRESGLTQNVSIHYDLNVHIEHIHEYRAIEKLRTCLFFTFFVDNGPVMHNSVALFFTGRYHQDEKLIHKASQFVKPVNCISLPSVSQNIDIVELYTLFANYITTKVHNQPKKSERIINKCLLRLLVVLKEQYVKESNEDGIITNLSKMFPFRQGIDVSESLKDISVQDIYLVYKPYLEEFMCALQSTLQQHKAREIFLELFKKPFITDAKYQFIAWISIYFIYYCSKTRQVQKYVHINFVNLTGDLDIGGNDYAFQDNQYWCEYYHLSLITYQNSKVISRFMDPKTITLNGNYELSHQRHGRESMKYIVHLNLSLEKSQIQVLQNARKSKALETCYETSMLPDSIDPFEKLRNLYLETYSDYRKTTPIESAAEKPFHSFIQNFKRLDFANFNINDIQGQFHYYPKKLLTFSEIINEMHIIEFHSQTPKLGMVFRFHTMKILLTLYIMHIKEKLNLKTTRIAYVIILDPLLDKIVGKKQSLVRYFAQEFGLLAQDEDVKKRMVIFKKRRAYIWKLQEDLIFCRMPVLGRFFQIQITKNYCQSTLNMMCLENREASSVEVGTELFKYNFFDQVVENLWSHLETRNEGTLASFESFKIQMNIYLKSMFSLDLDADLDTPFRIILNNNTFAEFTYRTVIESALIPAIDNIVSFFRFVVLRYGSFPKPPWHTFIMLENFVGKDVGFSTNTMQQLLKYEIEKKINMFYDNNIEFDRSDYSITEINDSDMCFVNNEPLGLYSLTTGITHLHRVFDATYAIKFHREGYVTDDLTVHECGNSLYTNLVFIFAKKGEKFKSQDRGFNIYNVGDKTVSIDFLRLDDTNGNESIDKNSALDKECQLLGTTSFSVRFFNSNEYKLCPIFLLKSHCHTIIPLMTFDISTPLDIEVSKSYGTVHPITLSYSE